MEGFLNPSQILSQLGLSSNVIAADFGSGSGGWAIPLAKILKDGKVFAIDILKEPLSVLGSRAKSEKILNIKAVCSNVETEKGSKLGENALDLVLMTNLLFQLDNKRIVFAESKRILKKEGKILVVDWLPQSPLGPEKGRVLPEEVKKIAKEIGFSVEKEFNASSHHYGIVFVKI